ncbi:hypothetical protein ACHAWF_011677 [Thalassiosira exigua]
MKKLSSMALAAAGCRTADAVVATSGHRPPSSSPSMGADVPSSTSVGECEAAVLTPRKVPQPQSEATPGREKVRVAVRFRPLGSGERSAWRVDDSAGAILQIGSEGEHEAGMDTYGGYARVFGEGSSNRDVYNGVVERIVADVIKGYHGTVFTYGQTSSGKTYTMQGHCGKNGEGGEGGILQMAAKGIFKHIDGVGSSDYEVKVSYVEVYNESVRDLLVTSNNNNEMGPSLKVRPNRRGDFFAESKERIVASTDDLLDVLAEGEGNRSFGSTAMNQKSSRSHTLFSIQLESKPKFSGDECTLSTLKLVDLAGSESVRRTGAVGDRQREGGKINQSLGALSAVIKSLGQNAKVKEKATPVGYRGSKLTMLLQPSLSGNAKLAVICCATPSESYLAETRSTLQFAQRVGLVATRATKSRRRLTESAAKQPRRSSKIAGKIRFLSPTRPTTSPGRIRPMVRRLPQTEVRQHKPRQGTGLFSSIPEDDEDFEALHAALAAKNATITSLESKLRSAKEESASHSRHQRAEIEWLQSENVDLRRHIARLLSDRQFQEEEVRVTEDFSKCSASKRDVVPAESPLRDDDSDATEECAMSSESVEISCVNPASSHEAGLFEELVNSKARIIELEGLVRELRAELGSYAHGANGASSVSDVDCIRDVSVVLDRGPRCNTNNGGAVGGTGETRLDEKEDEILFSSGGGDEMGLHDESTWQILSPPVGSPAEKAEREVIPAKISVLSNQQSKRGQITPLGDATSQGASLNGGTRKARARRKTARYSPSCKKSSRTSMSTQMKGKELNADFGAVGYKFKKNFGSRWGTYEGVVSESDK